jgi:hypothetical protein
VSAAAGPEGRGALAAPDRSRAVRDEIDAHVRELLARLERNAAR